MVGGRGNEVGVERPTGIFYDGSSVIGWKFRSSYGGSE